MPIIGNAKRIFPHAQLPSPIIQNNQEKAYLHYTKSRKTLNIASDVDRMVYGVAIIPSGRVSQSQGNALGVPSVDYTMEQIQTPIIEFSNKAIISPKDDKLAGVFNTPNAVILDATQYQAFAEAGNSVMLFGINSQTGVLNSGYYTQTTLPADSSGNTTISTYNPADLQAYLLGLLSTIMTNVNSTNVKRIFLTTSQQIINQITVADVVSLTSYQLKGAGVGTTGTAVKDILARQGVEFEFIRNDNLKGIGAGGSDIMFISVADDGENKSLEDFAKMNGQYDTNAVYNSTNPQLGVIEMVSNGAIVANYAPLENGNMVRTATTSMSTGWVIKNTNGYIVSAEF